MSSPRRIFIEAADKPGVRLAGPERVRGAERKRGRKGGGICPEKDSRGTFIL